MTDTAVVPESVTIHYGSCPEGDSASQYQRESGDWACFACGAITHRFTPTETPVDYEGHGLRSSGFPVPEPVVVPERVAIRLLKSDVVEGVGDAGASEWIQPPRETGFLVGIPALSLTFGSPVMVDPVAVVAWIRRVSQYDGAVTVGSWVNPDTGAVCFDACDWHERAVDAGRNAHIRNEHSYFNVAASDVVRTAS